MVIKLDESFYGVCHAAGTGAKIFVTHDLFAGANLVVPIFYILSTGIFRTNARSEVINSFG